MLEPIRRSTLINQTMVEILRQAGAIPFDLHKGSLRVLLITSRDTGRWVIPKGGVEHGFTARQAAAQEAYEEAGIKGTLDKLPLGFYTYIKRLHSGRTVSAWVEVYALRVEKRVKNWPERDQRKLQWMDIQAAIAAVEEPGMASLLSRLEEIHGGPTHEPFRKAG